MARVEIYPDCNDRVAHLGGVRRELRHTADEKAAVARGYLAAHRAEGFSEITVTRGTLLDYFVNLDDKRDRRKGQHAAAAIEFGNKYGGGGIDVLGRTFGLT